VLTLGARFNLVAFHLVDTHLHTLVACSRREAGGFARTLEGVLRKRLLLPTPFERARFSPVESQRHLERAFLYILRQSAHHGLPQGPLFEGSNLLDLRGQRVVGAYTRALATRLMPRMMTASDLKIVGHRPTPQGLQPSIAVECALVASSLPTISGKAHPQREARAALAQALDAAKWSSLAREMGVTRAALSRARCGKPRVATELVEAIRRCLGSATRSEAAIRRPELDGPGRIAGSAVERGAPEGAVPFAWRSDARWAHGELPSPG